MAVPSVPKSDASWFQIIKAQNKKQLAISFKGPGVPINTTIDKTANHGYWLRFKRQKPGGIPLPPSFSFYYTGTGPRATLKWGEVQDSDNQDGVNRVTWVKGPDADTTVKPRVAKRDPEKHPLLPVRFPPGDGPVQGFRIDPFQSQRGRSLERGQMQRSRSADPPQRRERSQSRNRNQPKQHAIPKRVLLKNKTISEVFGKRNPTGANVGSADTESTGLSDPRLMNLLRYTPTAQELLFAGHLKHQLQPEGVQLTFNYTITVKRDSADYERIKEALDSVVGQSYTTDDKQKTDKPADKKVEKKKKLDTTPSGKPAASIVSDGDTQVINWGTKDPSEGLESFS
uniref:Nucleocapsid protein n=1 Tax=Bird deltacoronavirus AnasCN24 TaxID=3237947 RepID=A0AB39AG63_9NIDO